MEKRSFKERLRNEYLGEAFSIICGLLIITVTISIILFIATRGIRIFAQDGYTLSGFLLENNWYPDKGEEAFFGALAFILGSTLVSIGSVIISAPIAVILAVFVNVISKGVGSKVIKPCLEILVGIPSVVYGWVGISVLVPFIKKNLGGMGFSLLSGILVLSLMILPTIATLSIDSIRNVPIDNIEASYGLGATRWQTIYRVILPGAKSGILTGIVLGIARAFGEALAVQMVIGNTIKIPNSILSSMSTLTSILTMQMANTVEGTPWNNALWTVALILLLISFIFIVIIRLIEKRGKVQ